MGKSGGIIAIIAGVLGLFAAAVTLMAGGVGAVFNVDDANSIIVLGWGGVFFCFLTIIFGAVAINAQSRMPGVLIIISSISGAFLGGNLVAILMVLALAGGILATIGHSAVASNTISDDPLKSIASNAYPMPYSSKSDHVIAAVIVVILLIVANEYLPKHTPQADASAPVETAPIDPLEELDDAPYSSLEPNGNLAEKFSYGNDFTDLQRQMATKEIVGKIIKWRLPVYDVKQSGDEYIIHTANTFREIRAGESLVSTIVHIKPRDLADKEQIENLKTGDLIKIKGIISDVIMRNLVIEPAILVNENFARSLLNQVYSQYDLNQDCWMMAEPIYAPNVVNGEFVTDEQIVTGSQNYCMRIGLTNKVTHNGVDRYYVLSLGDAVDEKGDLNGAHFENGRVGAFIAELRNGQTVLIASDPSVGLGSFGQAPRKWEFINLGPNNFNGWHTETEWCGMGQCDISHVILAPHKKKIRNIAGHIPSSHLYYDSSHEAPSSEVKVHIEIDASNPNHKVFPLKLSIASVKEGKHLAPQTLRTSFNLKQWEYDVPK